MSPSGDPFHKRALVVLKGDKVQRDLERKALAAAFKLSFESGDTDGARLAHQGLCAILQQQLYDDRDGSSSGSVIPPSVWKTENQVSSQPGLDKSQTIASEAAAIPTSSSSQPAPQASKAAPQAKAKASASQSAEQAEPISTRAGASAKSKEQRQSEAANSKPDKQAAAAEMAEPETAAQPAETPGLEPEEPAASSDELPASDDLHLQHVQILDPGEIEEAFALIDMTPAADTGTAHYTVDAAGTSLHARSAQMLMEVPRSLGGMPIGGEITAALERLTAAMPASAAPQAAGPGPVAVPEEIPAQPEPIELLEPPPEQEILAQPVIEMPAFEAPPPQLEEQAPPAVPDSQFAPEGGAGDGPLSYLDFGDEAPAAPAEPPVIEDIEEELRATPELIAQMFAQAEAKVDHSGLGPPPAPLLTPSQLIKTQSFYQILGVNKLSSYDQIHKKFVRLARRMLRTRLQRGLPAADVREFREVLRAICVAHDVLRDPVTRTDYDLRQLGMRQESAQAEDAQPENAIPRTRLMIGELLEIANILDRTELQIALDMHKAEPGTMFGTFLVRAGFLDPEELDSALLGQRLISAGKITVAQFQSAMFRMRDHSAPFFDTLVVEGWLTPADMLNESAGMWNKGKKSESSPAQAPAAEGAATPPADDAPASASGSNGHAGDDHASMVAAAKRAEAELLKSLESDESTD